MLEKIKEILMEDKKVLKDSQIIAKLEKIFEEMDETTRLRIATWLSNRYLIVPKEQPRFVPWLNPNSVPTPPYEVVAYAAPFGVSTVDTTVGASVDKIPKVYLPGK